MLVRHRTFLSVLEFDVRDKQSDFAKSGRRKNFLGTLLAILLSCEMARKFCEPLFCH